MSGKINIPGNSFSIHVKHHKATSLQKQCLWKEENMQTTGQTIIIAGSMLLFPCARPYHVSEVRRRLACVCHSFVPDLTMSLRYEDWPVCAIPLYQILPCLSGMKTGLCEPFLCTRSYHVSQE